MRKRKILVVVVEKRNARLRFLVQKLVAFGGRGEGRKTVFRNWISFRKQREGDLAVFREGTIRKDELVVAQFDNKRGALEMIVRHSWANVLCWRWRREGK